MHYLDLRGTSEDPYHYQKKRYTNQCSVLLIISSDMIIIHWLLYSYLRFLFLTYTLRVVDERGLDLPLDKTEGLYYFWQEHSIAGLYFLYKQQAHGHFVSDGSKDGLRVAFCARRLGLRVLFGSSQVSFSRSALEVLDLNKRMYVIGDGRSDHPRTLARYVPYLSAKTGVPLVHLSCSVSAAFSLVSRWDKLAIPLPFSTVTVTVKRPVYYGFDDQGEVIPLPSHTE